MTSTTTRAATPAAGFTRATRAQFRNELRLLLRDPAAMLFGAVLPLVAVVVMSAIPGARQPLPQFGGHSVVQAYVPTLILFATSVLGLTVLPGILGGYRELGVLRRLRTTPASPVSLLLAVFALTAAVGVLVSALIVAVPTLFGVPLPPELGGFALGVLLSLCSFAAVGTVLAAVIPNSRVAAGLGNVVAAVMWFCAGLWYPRALFPDWLDLAAGLTPGGAGAEALTQATAGSGLGWQPVLVLLGWTVLAGLAARATFRWE